MWGIKRIRGVLGYYYNGRIRIAPYTIVVIFFCR